MSKTESQLSERPPVVVVMGHVDHGKSTLLDFIRKSNTVDREAGGITQHVAAYEVEREKNGEMKRITFIDTPGHAAFSAIRARGANVADIAILVVAADDGVKAQTLEALSQIRDAKIPFIVAINKIDKPNADVMRTQTTLLEQQVYLEKFGGDVPWVAISAKAGTGVDELLDLILLVAEFQDFRADPMALATGYVIEAHRDSKRGIAATIIIKNGTLSSGMGVVAADAVAPVRIMENHLGKIIKEATFSTPITLTGFDALPDVGAEIIAYKTKRDAESARDTTRDAAPRKVYEMPAAPGTRYLMPVIIRADATGSLEAIAQEALKVGDEHAGVIIVHSAIGTISENDVKAAAGGSSIATVIGFNVTADAIAHEYARQHGVKVELFDIIYKLTERLEELLKESAPKRTVEEVTGRAKIIRQFSSRKTEHVVGGAVSEGAIAKGPVRILRRGTMLGMGKIVNMQTNKQNVEKVDSGNEFGTQIEAPFEIAAGDTLETFVIKTV